MARDKNPDSHEFIVTGVELADDQSADGVAIVLQDAHGGKVRLHLNSEMAELLRSKVALALAKKRGP